MPKCGVGHSTVIAADTVVVDQSKMMWVYVALQRLEPAHLIAFQEPEQDQAQELQEQDRDQL
jgi:hypothetical protein